MGKAIKIYAQHVKDDLLSQKGSYFKHSHTAVVCIVHQILFSNSNKLPKVGNILQKGMYVLLNL